ncbi:hypothetical protein CC78DRAFT_576431 [Lojkania enalia]|uniref:Uncharacterized protein n=1 Tax=Lojkania enalia TaxID=147567 RepID=A0A9P4KHL1_9PLEO|nr:hypothetical protein CC78DRAFT_576431 [Didymosphaeria enalia]
MNAHYTHHSNPQNPQSSLLTLSLSLRYQIYKTLILPRSTEPSTFLNLSLTCRQINEEFLSAYNYHKHSRFQFCLARSHQSRSTTQFHTWSYHTTPWGSPISITPSFASRLKECVVRCTIEELSDFERRSEVGGECFKDCMRILTRTFKGLDGLRKLEVVFDCFVFEKREGLYGREEVFARVRQLCDLPGAKSITVVLPGEMLVWSKPVNKGRRSVGVVKENWILEVRERKLECENAGVDCRARFPEGYGFRRGVS